jgi:hypothetical protein
MGVCLLQRALAAATELAYPAITAGLARTDRPVLERHCPGDETVGRGQNDGSFVPFAFGTKLVLPAGHSRTVSNPRRPLLLI